MIYARSASFAMSTSYTTADEARNAVNDEADSSKVAGVSRFFKTGKGEYGEGDVFIGATVPSVRKVAKLCIDMPLSETSRLLDSEVHEVRLLGLIIMTYQFQKKEESHKEIHDLYIAKLSRVNNWNLVDSSAPQILGAYLYEQGRGEKKSSTGRAKLDELAISTSLWERRIAIIATQFFIRNDEFDDTIRIANTLLNDPHDLIHKAVGWMLREVGKRKLKVLTDFLNQNAAEMPRTMLRYAIEKLPPAKRRQYLNKRAPPPPEEGEESD
eukprot:CAMPEP_0184354824 /NCGR_PEP_ID=MMETSP1089-20130417/91367_1 /TAXON_ID=38269 ORGANISM="Gloeochaete wittrockiana, Strain SAG46.84" /NCGR_SAMPLE_ID=MMETSP1089 /ASSEMBLY_ACC=CAM_ASM_000445 /LENGTH=268 /DNA_ID=CAMNT_0026691077 /DNA_START=99 /DNA_END=905 /DNA_ORIENTATION=-